MVVNEGGNTDEESIFLWNNCLPLLPQMLKDFLSQQNVPETFSQKVIDFFIELSETNFQNNVAIRNCLFQVFNSLSSLKTFQSNSVWTHAASILFL